MALKSHFGEGGRELWNRWSASSEKFDQHTQDRIWRSFRGEGVGIGTIFHYSRGRSHAG
jgi:putative DNA primase/helicase